MMCGMGQGMVWGLLLGVFLLLGFAYIVWLHSTKESGATRVVGQVIAGVITLIALLILIYGSLYGGQMMGGQGKGDMMQRPGMQDQRMMQEMMKDPGMRQMMMQQMMREKMGK